MTQRQYSVEDFLYYGQKVMVNPEISGDKIIKPGEVGVVIDADIGDGKGVPYVLENPSRIPGWTVTVRWEKSGTSGWQIKELLAINEDVVPVTRYSTSHGNFTVIDGEVDKHLDTIMIQQKGEVGKISRFNETKRRELIERAKAYHKGGTDPDLPFF